MGIYLSFTSMSIMLPGYLISNTSTGDAEGVANFTRQLNNAEAEVNSVIVSRYDITAFTAVPPLVRKLAEDIAVYNIFRTSGYRANIRNNYIDDYKTAKDTLTQLVKGEINLAYTDGSSVAVISTSRFLNDKQAYSLIFGMDTATSWKRDSDEVDDQSDARS